MAKITALGAKQDIDWPDFLQECIDTEGAPLSEIVVEGREDRF